MSMNKTCPISNFTSEDCSDGMRFLLSYSRFNQSIPIQEIVFTDGNLVNVAPLQLGEEVVDLHFYIVGLCFERQGIRGIIEVCILTLGHSSPPDSCQLP